jgi:hypothetical protein
MTPLERACYFATWCSASRFRTAAKLWMESAMTLAEHQVAK